MVRYFKGMVSNRHTHAGFFNGKFLNENDGIQSANNRTHSLGYFYSAVHGAVFTDLAGEICVLFKH